MPNFITHWLVANECIGKWTGSIPPYIKSGRTAYTNAVDAMRDDLNSAVKMIKSKEDLKKFKKIVEPEKGEPATGSLQHIIKTFDDAVQGIEEVNGKKVLNAVERDDITCFFAYMLGACGPDFWTLPCEPMPSTGSTSKSIAPHHFDLGHYNRAPMIFKTFVYHLAKNKTKFPAQDDIKTKVAISYFIGLATHFAADLILHQLVNVSAGAYGLLEKKWRVAEQGIGSYPIAGQNVQWSTHNKVEHYWDSYLRYVYFSGYGYIWKDSEQEKTIWKDFSSLGFPVVEQFRDIEQSANVENVQPSAISLSKLTGKLLNKNSNDDDPGQADNSMPEDVKRDAIKFLTSNDGKLQIEKCFNLPRVFCDRMTAKDSDLTFFIYDIIVGKEEKAAFPGAYPKDLLYQAAITEANSEQFNADKGSSEKKKLGFFSSAANGTSLPANSLNCLNYETLPDLDKVKKYGLEKFYDLSVLPDFIHASVATAGNFLSSLKSAIDKAFQQPKTITDAENITIGTLGHFWNLDTGLGLRIESGKKYKTTKEACTILHFFHVLDEVNRKKIGRSVNMSYVDRDGKKKVDFDKNPKERNYFKIYYGKEHDDIISVEEEKGKCLDRIRVKNTTQCADSVSAPTTSQNKGKPTEVVALPMWNRLNLEIKAGIADLQNGKEKLGFYFLGDDKKEHDKDSGSLKGYTLDEKFVHKWIIDKKTKAFDFIQTSDANPRNNVEIVKRSANGVCEFSTHFLVTVEKEDDKMKQAYESGKWCNVIPYEQRKDRYGSNFAVGTGRQNILHPKNWKADFNGLVDFECYQNVSPSEYVYFSVHPLIKLKDNPNMYMDIITKQEYEKSKISELIKINWVGFVKVVLLYEYFNGEDRGPKLTSYYIDGCRFNA